MGFVYLDASSAILLFRAELFEQTAQVFSLVVAGEVFRELTRNHYPGARCFREMAASRQIRLIEDDANLITLEEMDGFSAMDRGEQETIAHYLEPGSPSGSFILIDDGQGARFCHRHHIPFINALLVPKIFWYSGLMNETDTRGKIEILTQLGRYSSRIISKACKLSATDLAHFIPGKGN